MSLGILRVGGVLEDRGFDVEMIDLSGIKNPQDVISSYVQSERDVIDYGITATTPQVPASVRIRDTIKNLRPDAHIILGGPHVTLTNAAFKKEKLKLINGRATKAFHKMTETFDCLVAGDGEEAIFLALEDPCLKLIDADDPKSNLFLKPYQLSEIPFPARHLIDVSSYHHDIDGKNALNVILQLGCPFACGFCGGRNSPSFRRIRLRSTESVVKEIRQIYTEYGTEAFMFHDDELNVNPEMINMLKGLIRLQEELGVNFLFRCFIKAQLFTDEQAKIMYQAGFRRILVGFEAADPRILRNIRKSSTLEENTRCMEIAKRHNLKVKALMSIGHPGESAETVEAVKNWLIQVEPHDFDVTIITTYCGTPYHDDAVPNEKMPGVWTYSIYGDNLHSYEVDYSITEDYYKGKPDEGYCAYVFTDYLSSEELVRLRDLVEREVRTKLGIPYYNAGTVFEHSMGQGNIPSFILKKSNP